MGPLLINSRGAPDDEYDALTFKIIGGVVNHVNVDELILDIINLLNDYYGTPNFDELSAGNQVKLKTDVFELINSVKELNLSPKK